MKTIFTTTDIDLAAAIIAATGVEPDMHQKKPGDLATFTFPDDPPTRSIILKFAAGDLILDVRRFANRRAWLYRQVKGGRL